MIRFDPLAHTLHKDERLRLKAGILYCEKNSVRQKQSWLVRLFTRSQYSQVRLLAVVLKLAQKSPNQLLFANYRTLIGRAHKQNQAYTKTSHCWRFFLGKSKIALTEHEKLKNRLEEQWATPAFIEELKQFEEEGAAIAEEALLNQDAWQEWLRIYQKLVSLGERFEKFKARYTRQIPAAIEVNCSLDKARAFKDGVVNRLNLRVNELEGRVTKHLKPEEAKGLCEKVTSIKELASLFEGTEAVSRRCDELLHTWKPLTIAAPFSPEDSWLQRGKVDRPRPYKNKTVAELGKLFTETLQKFDTKCDTWEKGQATQQEAQEVLDTLEQIVQKLNKKRAWIFPRPETLKAEIAAILSSKGTSPHRPRISSPDPSMHAFDLFTPLLKKWSAHEQYSYLKPLENQQLEEIGYYFPQDSLQLIDNINKYFENSSLKEAFQNFELVAPRFGALNDQMYTVIQLRPKAALTPPQTALGDKLLWNFLAHGELSYADYFAFHIPAKGSIAHYQFTWEAPENSHYLILFHRPVKAPFSLGNLEDTLKSIMKPELRNNHEKNEERIKDQIIEPKNQFAINCIMSRLAKAH